MSVQTDRPSLDRWLAEIKSDEDVNGTGMFLMHNGVVRGTSRNGDPVSGMRLHTDYERLAEIVESARLMEGVNHVRVWVNQGDLVVGDDIMFVLVGGDIRDHVFDALRAVVKMIKTEVVTEEEQRL